MSRGLSWGEAWCVVGGLLCLLVAGGAALGGAYQPCAGLLIVGAFLLAESTRCGPARRHGGGSSRSGTE